MQEHQLCNTLVVNVQYGAHPSLYHLRFQDEEDPGEFQRDQVYRVYHVLHVYRLAGVRPHLLRNRQRRFQGMTPIPIYYHKRTAIAVGSNRRALQ